MQIKKNKILLVIPNLQAGGAERLFIDFLRYIDLCKFEVWVCLFEGKIDYNFHIREGIKTVCLNKKHKLDFFLLIYRMVLLIKKEEFSCIHAWLFYANMVCIFSKILLKVFYGCRCRLIISTHNDYVVKFKSLGIKGYLHKLIVRVFFNKADIITSISHAAANGLIYKLHLNPKKIRVIYNGVDIKEITQRSQEPIGECNWFFDNKNLIIISVGALNNQQKDWCTLLHAFSIVYRYNKNAKLLIIGKGKDRQKLEKFIQDLDLTNVATLLGFHNNPYKFVRRSKVFVLPSIYEGLPVVLLEAMALKIPMVITNISVANELVRNGRDAFIVPVRTPAEMANAILKLLNSDNLHRYFSENSFKIVKAKFVVEVMARNYLELYTWI